MLGSAVPAGNRDITYERLLCRTATEIMVRQPVHESEVEIIKIISRSRRWRLWDAIAMILSVGIVDTWCGIPGLLNQSFRKSNPRCTAPRNRHPCRGKSVFSGRVRTNQERSFTSGRRRQTVDVRGKKSELRFV